MRADSRTNKVWTGSRTYLWIYCHKDFLSWWLRASVKRLLLPVVTNLLWQNPGAPNPVQWQAQHTCVTTREIQDGKRKVIYFRHVDVTIKLNYRYLYYSYISTVPCILLLQHCTMHTFLPYYAFYCYNTCILTATTLWGVDITPQSLYGMNNNRR